MLNKYKWKILISSLAILLPFAVSLIIKDRFTNGMRGAWYFTWIMPLVLLLVNTLCLLITLRDNSNDQNVKIMNMIFWIIPTISIFSSGVFLAMALGVDMNVGMLVCLFLGVTLMLIGNYMPKATRNRTFGIKMKWTLANDANWIATHRFAGKLWFACGFVVLAIALIPERIGFILLTVLLAVVVIPPVIYSYIFYKKQLASGEATAEEYASYPKNEQDKKTLIISLVITGALLVGITIMMFVGNIDLICEDSHLEIKTSFGGGMTLDYNDIESIEYRDEAVDGTRIGGYGSARLLFGWFENEEFGSYTRYTYTNSESAIIIRTKDEIFVIAEKTPEETRTVYETVLSKID